MQSTAGLPQAQSVRLAFGLRNFGAQYAHTRHNAGEWWVARVAARNQASFAFSDRQRAEQAVVAGVRIARNCTYMNESGFSVGAVVGFYKIPAAAVLIAHDELDLPCGSARLKFGGGLAGHNGLRDVKRVFASSDYWRLRIGIGRPQAGHDAAAYVLSKPPPDEMELIEHAIERAASVWPQIVAGDMDAAMRILHGEES